MDIFSLLKSIGALLLVLGLIGLSYMILRRLNLSSLTNFKTGSTLVKIEDVTLIDPSRKLVVAAFGSKKYLLLLGTKDVLLDVVTDEK